MTEDNAPPGFSEGALRALEEYEAQLPPVDVYERQMAGEAQAYRFAPSSRASSANGVAISV